jgi:hypothetical protein
MFDHTRPVREGWPFVSVALGASIAYECRTN